MHERLRLRRGDPFGPRGLAGTFQDPLLLPPVPQGKPPFPLVLPEVADQLAPAGVEGEHLPVETLQHSSEALQIGRREGSV